MSDFEKRFANGLNTMHHQTGPVQPSPTPTSPWQMLTTALGISPQASASDNVPQNNVPKTQAAPIDPYENMNNRIQGKPYR